MLRKGSKSTQMSALIILVFSTFFEAYVSKKRAQGLWIMLLERTEY